MAFTQSDVDAIKKAIATGSDQVNYPDGSSVHYRSMDDLLKALALAEREVAGPTTVVSFASYWPG